MTFGERLTQLRKEHGYTTRNEFADKLGIPSTTLRNYETDAREPGHTFLKQISEFFNVSVDYLLCLTDDKEVLKSFRLREPEQIMVEKYRSLDASGREIVDFVLDREVSRSQRIAELEKRPAAVVEFHGRSDVPARAIKYFHSVSAGTGQVLFDDVYSEDAVIPDIPKYRRVAYAVKVSGRSMEPLFYDGDMLLVEPACEIDVGEIGIFNVDGQAYVKKLGEHELISLNEEYDNIPLDEGSRCMGRVVDKYSTG